MLLVNKENNNEDRIERPLFKIEKLNEGSIKENLLNIKKIISDDSYTEIKREPYIQKNNLYHQFEILPHLELIEFEEFSKNKSSILKVSNNIKDDSTNEVKEFMKFFKLEEEFNINILEKIFKPNLPTKAILTDIGTHVDFNELIKFFYIPNPYPKIYREFKENFIKNYGVTVIIDSSASCFSSLSINHTWKTIQILLSSLGSIDIPCFDLIITGEPNPYIICSEKNTLEILSETSTIWIILFDLLQKNYKNTDLASAIRVAYNLHNLRKSEHPDYLFVITDGLFPISETKRIIENISICEFKGINIFGIGVGISPFGIEKLFPNIIYSLNPYKLIQGIFSCISGDVNDDSLKAIDFETKIKFNDIKIEELKENIKFKNLKNKLMDIPVKLKKNFYNKEKNIK